MLVGKHCPTHLLVKFQHLKIHKVLHIKPISLKLWLFTNFNMGFPVVLLVFDVDELSEGVLSPHFIILIVSS
jgi:hypothetical protein